MSGRFLYEPYFPQKPTADQAQFCEQFEAFFFGSNRLFVLKGYAGTGKTTSMKAVSHWLAQMRVPVVLMAPTGRAAKVLAENTGKRATTIHRTIYQASNGKDGNPVFKLKSHKFKKALFVVDEASMIGAGITDFQGRDLLNDLFEFCFGDNNNCQLLFVGDTAQLPPVGSAFSPALNADFLKNRFFENCVQMEMKEVVRQALHSNILNNATNLRNSLNAPENPKLLAGKDLIRITDSNDALEAVESAFQNNGEDAIYLVRSNKRANAINQTIRGRILYRENELEMGDRLMVIKNNYFWLDKELGGFIANGDMLEVLRLSEVLDRYSLRFAKAKLKLQLGADTVDFEAYIHLNTLTLESPAFSQTQMQALFNSVLEDYNHLNRNARLKAIKEDPFFQALQVKFAYAVTCHKAQGGQWKHVFVERPWLPNSNWTEEDRRWLYTAFTRATKNLYLLGFENSLFE